MWAPATDVVALLAVDARECGTRVEYDTEVSLRTHSECAHEHRISYVLEVSWLDITHEHELLRLQGLLNLLIQGLEGGTSDVFIGIWSCHVPEVLSIHLNDVFGGDVLMMVMVVIMG